MAKSKLLVFFALVLLFSIPAGMAYAKGHVLGTAMVSDGNAMSDVLTVTMEDATQPDEGMHWVAWLLSDDGEMQLNVGALNVDANGNVSKEYVSDTGANLLASYGQFVITLESDPAAEAPSGDPALVGYLADEANLAVARMLLVESDDDASAGSLTQLRAQLGSALAHANMARASDSQEALNEHAQMASDAIDDVLSLSQNAIDIADEAGAGAVSAAAGNVNSWAAEAKVSLEGATNATSLLAAKTILSTAIGFLDSSLNGVTATGEGGAAQAYVAAQGLASFGIETPRPVPTPTPTPTPEPTATPTVTPVPPPVGDSAIPALAQLATVAALVLLAAGSAIAVGRGRRNRA